VLTKTATFAPTSGRATLKVELVRGQSTVTGAYASTPMKVLTPVSRGRSAWVCLSSFGGGLVAGDETRLDVELSAGARCFLGTQASTKVYRNPAGRPCSHTTRATLAEAAVLVFAPDPLQAFADSHYRQRQEFQLAPGSALVLLDWFTSGRAARGERWQFSHLESRNDIFSNGELAVLDSIRLNSPSVAAHMDRFNCLATLLIFGAPLKSAVETVLAGISRRPVEKRGALAVSASPVRGGLLLRVAGESVEAVRHEIHGHLTCIHDLLGENPWARKW